MEPFWNHQLNISVVKKSEMCYGSFYVPQEDENDKPPDPPGPEP